MGIDCLIDSFEFILNKVKALMNSASIHSGKNEDSITLLLSIISFFDSLVLNLNETDPDLSSKYQMCKTLFSFVFSFGIKIFSDFFKQTSQINFSLLSICLDFIVDYLNKSSSFSADNKLESIVEKMKHIEDLIQNIVIPFLSTDNSMLFNQMVMSKLSSRTILLMNNEAQDYFKKISTNNLSYLPTTLDLPSQEQNILKTNPFPFLGSFVRLHILCFKLRMKLLDNKQFSYTSQFLKNSYLQSYLKAFTNDMNQSKDSAKNSYISMKYENLFVFYCLKLAFALFDFEVNINLNVINTGLIFNFIFI